MPPTPILVRVWLTFAASPTHPQHTYSTLVRSRDDALDPLEDAIAEARRRARTVTGLDGPCEVSHRILGLAIGMGASELEALRLPSAPRLAPGRAARARRPG